MPFGDLIQSNFATAASGIATVTFSAATAGNLLIFGVGRSAALAAGESWGTPAGWSNLPNTPAATGNVGGVFYYKIAAGGETTVSSAASLEPGNFTAIVVEIEGPFAASPLDQTAEDETNLATVVTSQASGTTGTTAQADELLLAFFASDSQANIDGSRTYSNSFTELYFPTHANTARAHAFIASRVVAATGTYSTTFSCTDTGDEMYGAIATFKKSGGGGGTPTRGRVSFAELEVPNLLTRGLVSFAELEVPNVVTRGRISFAEFEAPNAPTRGRMSFAELEVPSLLTRGLLSFAEFEVPALVTRGLISWAELEVPTAPTRGLVSMMELETPNAPTRGLLSWVELQTPELGEAIQTTQLVAGRPMQGTIVYLMQLVGAVKKITRE